MRDTIPHVAAISVGLAVLALAWRCPAPLQEIVTASGASNRASSRRKRDENSIGAERVGQREQQPSTLSSLRATDSDQPVVPRGRSGIQAQHRSNSALPCECDLHQTQIIQYALTPTRRQGRKLFHLDGL
jgi:hypothetical protein